MRQALYSLARQRRIGGDDTVHVVTGQQLGNDVDLLGGKVGGDLDHHGHQPAVLVGQRLASFLQGVQQVSEFVLLLQRTQVLGVWRRNVHGDVVGMGVDA